MTNGSGSIKFIEKHAILFIKSMPHPYLYQLGHYTLNVNLVLI